MASPAPQGPAEVSPRLRLRTLGTLDLRTSDDAPVDAVLGSVKRTALLLYLARRGKGSFASRDGLLALLWPEFDDERARNSLRTTLYALRTAVGPDVVIAHPDGSLSVHAVNLWCDANAYEVAVTTQDWPTAVGLYRGDFLEERSMPGMAEFEAWVEAERQRFRRMAVRSHWGLSEMREEAGDLGEAIQLGRRALALAPANELTLRRLVSLLHRSGDRGGALETYESFTRTLSKRFGVEPSPETSALMTEVLEGARTTERPPVAATDGRTAPARVNRPQPATLTRWATDIRAAPETTISISPFQFAGPPSESYLARAVEFALVGTLDRLDLPAAIRNGDGEASGADGGDCVEGIVTEAGGCVRITSTWRACGSRIYTRATVEGPSSRLLELVDALVEELLDASAQPSPQGGASAEEAATPVH